MCCVDCFLMNGQNDSPGLNVAINDDHDDHSDDKEQNQNHHYGQMPLSDALA